MTDFSIKLACDPGRSIIIEACAGSGKTWILISRILRLLLAGTKPHEILAITFTRKAAQEIHERLEKILIELANASDVQIQIMLVDRGMEVEQAANHIEDARGLLEKVLASPQKISIDTFHGWFGRLSRAAPIGSGIFPGQGLREDFQRLLNESLSAWWINLGAYSSQTSQTQKKSYSKTALQEIEILQKHYLKLGELLPPQGIESILTGKMSLIANRASWAKFKKQCESRLKTPMQVIRETFFLSSTPDPIQSFDWGAFEKNIARLAHGSPTQIKSYEKLKDICEKHHNNDSIEDLIPVLNGEFFTDKGTPRQSHGEAAGVLKKYLEAQGALHEYHDIFRICIDVLEVRKKWVMHQQLVELNEAWIVLGESMLIAYEDAKRRLRVQDFNDLEWQTLSLMEQETTAAYLQVRLDARYKQILIDEFQDTNPLQWQILQAWFNAYEADANKPKVFIVGDPKQSIYRFRRADARLFKVAREFLQANFDASYLLHNTTRRNPASIIKPLNTIFSQIQEYDFSPHNTLWRNLDGGELGGSIVRLELIERHSSEEYNSNRNPLIEPFFDADHSVRKEQAFLEGLQVASLMAYWRSHESVLDENSLGQKINRPATWNDFIILIRSKTHLHFIEKALRSKGIPFQSPRKGGLLNTLEADDLRALLEVLLTPTNNLALAHILRSPIFKITDAQMQWIAQGAESTSWWQVLAGSEVSSNLHLAYQHLKVWHDLSGHLPVHDLLDRIYAQSNIRVAYASTVPPLERERVLANLDAFLHLSLDIDGGRYPSLSRFIEELNLLSKGVDEESPDEGQESSDHESDDLTDLSDAPIGAVRIMTIHAAKGLEAPFIFLMNANADQSHSDSGKILLDWAPGVPNPQLMTIYTNKMKTQELEVAIASEEEIAKRENWNLLYVAMTRAKQNFVVSGVQSHHLNRQGPKGVPGTWYASLAEVVETDESLIKMINEKEQVEEPRALSIEENEVVKITDFSIGSWHIEGVAHSGVTEGPISEEDISRDLQQLMALGHVMHLILERCLTAEISDVQGEISLPSAKQLSAWLRISEELSQEAREYAHCILNSPQLKDLFRGSDVLEAWNELDLVDIDGKTYRIDRLVETPHTLKIIDYKLSIPDDNSELYQKYVIQLEKYKEIVARLRSDKPIEAYLIDRHGRIKNIQKV